MVFSVMTKNLIWEISTKNFVTFKRCDGVNDEKFKYYGSSLKDPILRGGRCMKKQFFYLPQNK